MLILWGIWHGILHNRRVGKKRGIMQRRVAIYCKEGRFEGVVMKGRTWLVPSNMEN